MADQPETYTWRRQRGLLRWGMEIPNVGEDDPAEMVHRHAVGAARLLDGFGVITTASWSSTRHGEDTLVQRFKSDQSLAIAQIERSIVPNCYEIDLQLDLPVAYPGEPTERLIQDGGAIHVEYDEFDQQPPGRPNTGVYLNVSLNTDIYARRTLTAGGDNRILADLNAPRLNRYLRAVQTHFGQAFTFVEYEGDRTQIDNNGFIGHD